MNVNPRQPDTIDPAVWQQPQVRAALAGRDIAAVYRRLQRLACPSDG